MNYKIFKTDLKPWLKKFFFDKFSYIIKAITGTIITITDGIRKKVNELKLSKESTQETTTGKQLFDKSTAILNYRIGLNGQATNDSNCWMSEFIKVQELTLYTKNSPEEDPYHRIAFYTSNDENSYISRSEGNTNKTPTGTNYVRFCGYKTEIDTAQLEIGNTATSYEPYTDGPSPNPNYPQEIKIVKGYRNLFNKDGDYNIYGVKTTIQDTSVKVEISNPGTYRSAWLEIGRDELLGKNINISMTMTASENAQQRAILCFGSGAAQIIGSSIGTLYTTGYINRTVPSTFPEGADRIYLILYASFGSSAPYGTYVIYDKVQITEGDTQLPYVPYGTNWVYTKVSNGTDTNYYTIPLNNNEIVGIGDYKDEYIVDKNGKCWLNKKTGKVVLDGSETVAVSNTGTPNWYYVVVKSMDNYIAGIGMSTHYPLVSISNSNTSQGFNLIGSPKSVRIRYGTEDTPTNFKNWLSNNNVGIYYALETPQLIDLNYTVDIRLFKGTNNISNSDDMDMSIKYYSK